jgi:hypothetical protein
MQPEADGDGDEPIVSLHGDDARPMNEARNTPALFVWLLTVAAGISGLLFGCKSSHPKCVLART